MQECSREIRKCIEDGLITGARYEDHSGEIRFDTGSSVKLINVASATQTRGLRCTRLLYDDRIDNQKILSRIAVFEVPETFSTLNEILKSEEYMVADTGEIDEFLSQFCEPN